MFSRSHVVRLGTAAELFVVDPSSFLKTGRLVSGMDEVFAELLAQKGKKQKGKNGDEGVTVVLPPDADSPDRTSAAASVERAAHQYCRLRAAKCEQDLQVFWRQGFRSLWSGTFLFVVGVALSYFFTEPFVSRFWDQLLGNGVFLVVAWVGLWYPLDLLFFSRQPLQRESRTWTAMDEMTWTVCFEVHQRSPEVSPKVSQPSTDV